MKSLLQILGEVHRGILLLAVLAGLLSGAATVGLLRVVGLELETLSAEPDRVGSFWGWALGLCVVRALAGTVAHVAMGWLTQESLRSTRRRFAEAVMGSPLRRVERVDPSRLHAAFGEDIQQVSQAVVNLPYFFVNLVVLLGCFVYLGWVSPTLLLVTAVALAAGACSYFFPVALANAELVSARAAHRRLCSTFADAISGLSEFRLDRERRIRYFEERLDPDLQSVSTRLMRGTWIYATAANWNRLLFFIYVFGILYLFPGAAGGSPIQVAGSILVILYMMAPLEGVLNATPHLGRAFACLEQVRELLTELGGEAEALPAPAKSDRNHDAVVRLELRDVVYRHAGLVNGDAALEAENVGASVGPITAIFQSGQITFLTGGNGAGKTTLLKVAAGLYPATEGTVTATRVSGQIEHVGADRLSASAIFHDFHLFAEPDKPDGSGKDVLSEVVRRLLEAEGPQVSAGQRKRQALKAELLRDRDVYFFDEWAAEQEPHFRDAFYHVILPELRRRNKIIVLVSHDDAFFGEADQELELSEGRLVRTTRRGSGQDPTSSGGETVPARSPLEKITS